MRCLVEEITSDHYVFTDVVELGIADLQVFR